MSALPEGFQLYRGILAHVSLDELREAIAWEQRTFRMYGREIDQPRLTSWMGSGAYTYSGQRHEPAPLPRVVADLKLMIDNLCGTRFNNVLANLYRAGGDSVAWHADDEPELGKRPTIASLSFGAARTFAIRTATRKLAKNHTLPEALLPAQRWDVVLEHGDLLIMSGRSQELYEHSIPKTSKLVGPRINLTFRNVA